MGDKVMEEKINDDRIKVFVDGIDEGPFKCLKHKAEKSKPEEAKLDSQYILDCNGKDHKSRYEKNDIYNCAVYQGYLDACRTMHGAGEESRNVKVTREAMADALNDYFAGGSKLKSKDEFDDWHKKTCDAFAKATQYTFGHAQKILNMAFKYLYCCADIRKDKSEYFQHCHMPLDSYILAWYKRECKTDETEQPGYKDEAWSSLNVGLYQVIKNTIRGKVTGNVLEAEFEIWQAEKTRIEKKEIKDAVTKLLKYIKKTDYESNLKQSLEEFRKTLEA